jgi:hypothetical protein
VLKSVGETLPVFRFFRSLPPERFLALVAVDNMCGSTAAMSGTPPASMCLIAGLEQVRIP